MILVTIYGVLKIKGEKYEKRKNYDVYGNLCDEHYYCTMCED
jgi:hypothetical protein